MALQSLWQLEKIQFHSINDDYYGVSCQVRFEEKVSVYFGDVKLVQYIYHNCSLLLFLFLLLKLCM